MVTVDNFAYLRLEWICKYVLENDLGCFLVHFVHSVLDTYTIPSPRQCGCRDGTNVHRPTHQVPRPRAGEVFRHHIFGDKISGELHIKM